MNVKKIKAAIRKFLRSKGVNPREDRYIANEQTRRTKSYDTGLLNEHGLPVKAHYQTVSWVLAPGAGRRAYKGLKTSISEARAS